MKFKTFGIKHAITLLGVMFLLTDIRSQEVELPLNIQSPTASGVARYGDVPVSYFTGVPDITIPLYDLNIKGLHLPITLTYNASGIRVDDHPGWVGQNWSLLAGGVITRTVRGGLDEYTSRGTNYGTATDFGYMFKYQELINATAQTKLKTMAGDGFDYEPDIFTFNFLGKTGKFLMGNDGKWKVSSESNLKIIFDLNTDTITPLIGSSFSGSSLVSSRVPNTNDVRYPVVIRGFKIVDGEGITYVFGHDKDAIEYSIDFFNQASSTSAWISNAWYLTKIIDKYGKELFNLTYTRGDYIGQFYRTIGQSQSGFSGSGGLINPKLSCSGTSGIDTFAIEGQLISPVYLKNISSSYNQLSIDFESLASAELNYSVDDLLVRANMEVQKHCDNYGFCDVNPFYYLGNVKSTTQVLNSLKWRKLVSIKGANKFIDLTYNNNYNERLHLLGIDIGGLHFDGVSDVKSDQKETYKFNYNKYQVLPNYLSKAVDHWGFYKGINYKIDPANLPLYYLERAPNPNFLTIGLLTNVIYPTGGNTTFIYEPNTYNQIVNDSRTGFTSDGSGIAGGVRIKTIIEDDGKKNIVRNFKYVLNYPSNKGSVTSSGILSSKPVYFWKDWEYISKSGTQKENIFSVNSIIPLSNSFGSHIGYSEVVEIRDDGSYSLYKYSNFGSNSYFDNEPVCTLNKKPSPNDRISDLSLLRGRPLSVYLYDNKNNLVQLRSSTYITDIGNRIQSDYVLGANPRLKYVCPSSTLSIYTGNTYKIFCFDYDVVAETVTNYLNGGVLTELTNYSKKDVSLDGNKIRLTTAVTKNGSDGLPVKTEYYYPTDLTSENGMIRLINGFRINEVIKTLSTKDGLPTGATLMTYNVENELAVPFIFKTSKTNEDALTAEINYDKHDGEGNLLQFHKRNGETTSLIWGYNRQYVVAKVENATYSEIQPYESNIQGLSTRANCNNCSKIDDFVNGTNSFRASLPLARITSYSYIPQIGITSITDYNQQTQYYIYDNSNRLTSILDQNRDVVKSYFYNYKVHPFLGLVTIESAASYEMGDMAAFNVTAVGGSGSYSYNWKLTNGSQTITGASKDFPCYISFSGSLVLSCTVTDNINNEIKTLYKNFNVPHEDCKFTNVFNGTNFAQGKIYSPLADKLTIRIISGPQDNYFNIGSGLYFCAGNQSQTITIEVAAKSFTDCKVGPDAQMVIQDAINNSIDTSSNTIQDNP